MAEVSALETAASEAGERSTVCSKQPLMASSNRADPQFGFVRLEDNNGVGDYTFQPPKDYEPGYYSGYMYDEDRSACCCCASDKCPQCCKSRLCKACCICWCGLATLVSLTMLSLLLWILIAGSADSDPSNQKQGQWTLRSLVKIDNCVYNSDQSDSLSELCSVDSLNGNSALINNLTDKVVSHYQFTGIFPDTFQVEFSQSETTNNNNNNNNGFYNVTMYYHNFESTTNWNFTVNQLDNYQLARSLDLVGLYPSSSSSSSIRISENSYSLLPFEWIYTLSCYMPITLDGVFGGGLQDSIVTTMVNNKQMNRKVHQKVTDAIGDSNYVTYSDYREMYYIKDRNWIGLSLRLGGNLYTQSLCSASEQVLDNLDDADELIQIGSVKDEKLVCCGVLEDRVDNFVPPQNNKDWGLCAQVEGYVRDGTQPRCEIAYNNDDNNES